MNRLTVLAMLIAFAAMPVRAQNVPLLSAPGKEQTEAACGTCHSLSYIIMHGRFLTPEIWKAEVTKMRMAFGAPIDDDTANAIVGYLAAQYGTAPKR